jgi:hypothetical protein
MSRSYDFWESMVLAIVMQSKYADTPEKAGEFARVQ